jgi:hypothetical protein
MNLPTPTPKPLRERWYTGGVTADDIEEVVWPTEDESRAALARARLVRDQSADQIEP